MLKIDFQPLGVSENLVKKGGDLEGPSNRGWVLLN